LTPEAVAKWLNGIQNLQIFDAAHLVQMYETLDRKTGNKIIDDEKFILRGECSGVVSPITREVVLELPGKKGVQVYLAEGFITDYSEFKRYETVMFTCADINSNEFGHAVFQNCVPIPFDFIYKSIRQLLWADFAKWQASTGGIADWHGHSPPDYAP
jgi:hypothetical protein